MVIAAAWSVILGIRGALGFLTRLPIPQSNRTWDAFTTTPVTFTFTGYLLGALFVFPFLFELPQITTGFLFVCWVYGLSGITHLDGSADFIDALVAAGSLSEKRDVLTDSAVGTGGALGIGIVLLGLFSAGFLITALPVTALGIVVAAEVVAKTSITVLIGFGTAFHDGLGSQFTSNITPASLVFPLLASLPVIIFIGDLLSGALLVGGGIVVTGLLLQTARNNLGGINGDVLGASNELVRVTALHLGVIGWML